MLLLLLWWEFTDKEVLLFFLKFDVLARFSKIFNPSSAQRLKISGIFEGFVIAPKFFEFTLSFLPPDVNAVGGIDPMAMTVGGAATQKLRFG
jgi:hypothetical protein